MKKALLFSIFYFLISVNGYSQPITWYRIWGLPGYQRGEQGIRVCQTFDGGYAEMVDVSSYGNNWFDLLKYDYLGNIQWVKIIVDTTINIGNLLDMQQTSDSGFIFAGWTYGARLIKINKYGDLQWQRNYTNLNSGTHFLAVKQTKDKGYISCGDYIDYVNPSMKGIVIKVDSLGFVQWEKQYLDSSFNSYYGIIQGFDKNYYIAGSTSNNQSPDYSMLKKLDTLGNVLNTNILYQNSFMEFIIQLKDSSLITGGQDKTTNYPLLLKFYPSGNIKWLKTYPTTYHYYFYFMSKDLFDNIIMTGCFDRINYLKIGNWKIDTSGTVLKIKEIDFTGYSFMGAECIKPTSDSGYILTGQINLLGNNDAITIKIDSAFNSPLITTIHNINSTVSKEFKIFQNYPNPFNPVTKINYSIEKQGLAILKVYDILGREIRTLVNEVKTAGNYLIEFNGSELPSGVYFYRIQAGNFIQVKKMILIK
jgi:hypothetical protein